MALSQIQCLDDNHVNPRTHESKPEFLYCEDQRVALEILLRDGREAFFKQLEARELRGFLSDLELAALTGAVEPYDPGAELYREDPVDEHTPLSLHYWPDMSDMSTPELDIGWPDSEAYRGVTRTAVHTQPPLDGQAHIKEIIRKTIAQAQKVIAVVMDIFTDVDIFRDLLDASFKRKVSVYILLERAYIPHFLSMCQRASMHAGHLKNIRVRCSGGTEFLTHSCTKISGHMGHRFMFIDGDKAISGSYSFTWMSSRLDRNLVTVVTGQAVDTFDRLFRFLYTTSKLVNLRHVATMPEPEPDPVPQPTSVAPPSAAVARKLYNPKYALVAVGNTSLSPSSSPGNNSPKESQKDTKNEEGTKKGRRRQSKDTAQEAPPLHPGLVDLEKAYLFDYLPTWPEPDPPSDVIGFINVRDMSKPMQVHLQRSEMFEVSQAIRFSSPFTKQKETLPEVAIPRNLTPAKQEKNPPQQKTQLENISKGVKPTETDKENTQSPSKEMHGQSQTHKIHTSTAQLSPQVPQKTTKLVTTPAVSTSNPKTEEKTDASTSSNSKGALQNRNSMESTQPLKLLASSDSKLQINTQNFSETTSTGNIPSAVNSTSLSANYQGSPATAVPSTLTSASPRQPSNAISTSVSKPTTNSPIATPPVTSPPVPKPRTVQLVIKDSLSNGQKTPEVSIVKKVDCKAKVTTVDNEPLVVTALPQKEPETVPEPANKSVRESIPQESTENTAAEDCSQQKESKKSQEEQASDKGELQPVAGNKIKVQANAQVTEPSIEANVNIHEDVPKKDEFAYMPTGVIIKTNDILKPMDVPIKNSDVAKVQSRSKMGLTYQAQASTPQSIIISSSDKNVDMLNSPSDRSPLLKPRHRSENTDTLNSPNDRSPILRPRSENVDMLNSPISRSPILKPKSENLDTLNSPIDRSPILKPKPRSENTDTLNSLIDRCPILRPRSENVETLNSPIDRSPILKPKSENVDTLNSPIDRSPILKPKSENVETLNSPVHRSLILKPKPRSENPDTLNPPIERSPILRPRSENVDTLNSSIDMSLILKPRPRSENVDTLNSSIDMSLILKPRPRSENVDTLNSPTERSPILKPRARSENVDTLNSALDRSPVLKPRARSENVDKLNSPIDRSPILKPTHILESIPTISVETQQGNILQHTNESVSQIAKFNSHTLLLSPRGLPEKPTHLYNTQISDLTIPEKDSRTLLTQRHSPSLDGFPSRVSSPDSRRSRTPDFRTPTSDISDGYASTASDEYYECSESPFQESKDVVPFYSLNANEDKEIHMANSCGSFTEQAATLSIERSLSSCETLDLSPKGSLSSILEKLDDEERLTNENSQKEIKRADGNLESQAVQDNNLSQSKSSKAESQVNQAAMAEQSLSTRLNNEATEAKRMPARELKPKRVYSRAERPDRLPAGGEKTALGVGGVERREPAPTASKEPEGHKQLVQKDPGVSSRLRPANPSRPPRPLSATQSTLLPHPTERKMSDGGLPPLDQTGNPSPSRQLPPRPPAPKAFPNQHYRQSPTSPTKPKAGTTHNQSPPPKPQPSFLYTHSQSAQQTHVSSPPHQNEAAALPARTGLEEEKSGFGITFSKLYNLKGLKDKMSKLPAQSRRSSSSGTAQHRKTTR